MKNERIGNAGRMERWFMRHRDTIAAVSGMATAISLFFTALSAFATWRQLDAMNRDRMTPFDTALYSARLENYHTIISRKYKFIEGLSLGQTSLESFLEDRRDHDRAKLLMKAAPGMISNLDQIRDALAAGQGLWGADIDRRLANAAVQITEDALCWRAIVDLGDEMLNDQQSFDRMCHNDAQQQLAEGVTDQLRILEPLMERRLRAPSDGVTKINTQ